MTFQIIISRDRQIERLERELESARSESASARDEAARMVKHFEAERIHWLDEKEKVIRSENAGSPNLDKFIMPDSTAMKKQADVSVW